MSALEPSYVDPLTNWPAYQSAVQVYQDEDLGPVLVITRSQKARHAYPCAECAGTIEAGEVYRYEWSMVDDSGLTVRRHSPWCPESE